MTCLVVGCYAQENGGRPRAGVKGLIEQFEEKPVPAVERPREAVREVSFNQLMSLEETHIYIDRAYRGAVIFLAGLKDKTQAERERAMSQWSEVIARDFIKTFRMRGASEAHGPSVKRAVLAGLQDFYAWLSGEPRRLPVSVLKFERYFGFKDIKNAGGWLWVPKHRDWVLVNVAAAKPMINHQTGRANFMYIHPDKPRQALPKGLYFWKSQDSRPVIKGEKGHSVKNNPQDLPFVYDSKTNRYVNRQKRTFWNPARWRTVHPF